MRISWDMQAVTGPRPTGLGVSVRLMLDALEQHAPDVKIVPLRPNDTDTALRGVPDRLRWEQLRLPAAIRRAHRESALDLHFTPSLGAPLRSPVPVVAHVQDLIPLHYPRSFSGVSGWYFKRLLPHTWSRARLLTASTSVLADELAAEIGYDRARIHVVPYYPAPEYRRNALKLRPDFAERLDEPPSVPRFLMLGSQEPRKNIELAIAALGLLQQRGVHAELVCVGLRTPHTERLEQQAHVAGIAASFVDYLPREQVVVQLLDCTALLFPSRYEGYGLPPLEAMSIGCAAIVSDIPAHREVYAAPERIAAVAGSDGLPPPLVGVDDPAALAEACQELVENAAYRARLRIGAVDYAATFSSADTARALRGAFAAALS